MKSTTQLIACLIAVPSVASLAVGPRATNVKASMGSNNPAMCTRLESQQQAGLTATFQEGRCAQPHTHALLFHHNAHREHARGMQPVIGFTRVLTQCVEPCTGVTPPSRGPTLTCPLCVRRKHLIDTEQWYECSEPADDPVMTCILAPEWMDLADESWLCSDALKSEDKRGRSSYGEDSY